MAFIDPDTVEKNKFKDPDYQEQGFVEDPSQEEVQEVGEDDVDDVYEKGESLLDQTPDVAQEYGEAVDAISESTQHGLTKAVGGVGQATGAFDIDSTIHAQEKELEEKYKSMPLLVGTGKLAGEVAPYMAVPGGLVGGTLRRMATGGLMGGAVGAAQHTDPGSSRLSNTVLGAGLGAAAPGFGSLFRTVRGMLSPTKAAEKSIGKAAPFLDAKNVAAGKQAGTLNTFLSPGEAAASPTLMSREVKKYISPKAQKHLSDKVKQRSTTLRKHVNDTVNSIVKEGPEAAKAKAAELYKKASAVNIPKSALRKIDEDPVLKKQITRIADDPDFALDDYKPGTVGYYNEVKKYVDNQLFKQTQGVDPSKLVKGSATATKNLQEVRQKLLKVLDDVSPEYQAARKLSRRLAIRQGYVKAIEEIPRVGGQTAPTSGQLYDKLFGTIAKERKFLGALKESGANTVQAKRLINVLNKVKGSKLDALLTQQTEGLGRLAVAQGPAGLVGSGIAKGIAKKNDPYFELMTNPAWTKEIERLHKMPKKLQANRLAELLKRASIVEATDLQE